MSVEFTAANDNEITEVLASGYSVPLTIALRAKIDSSQTDGISRAITIRNSGFSNVVSIYESGGNWSVQSRTSSQNGIDSTGVPIATTSFNSIVVTLEDATTYSIYIDGSIITNSATWGTPDFTGVNDLDRVTIGGRVGADQDWDGFISDVAVWTRALTDDEALAFTSGFSPLQFPDNLSVFWQGTNDIYADSMQTATFTDNIATPTLAFDDNPKIIFPE